jgi:hypothetical protein
VSLSPTPGYARPGRADATPVGGRSVQRCDHARAHPLAGCLGDELGDRFPGRPAERTEELAAMEEVGSQQLRERSASSPANRRGQLA